MKKPIHLYVFAVLSTIASITRIYTSFFARFNEEELRSAFQGADVTGADDLIAFTKAAHEFNTDWVNRSLAIILLIFLIVTIVFLFKKQNERASYIYIVYLFGTLIAAVYSYVGSAKILQSFSGTMMDVGGNSGLFGFLLNAILFAIYFGLTVFFLLRKPKDTPSVASNATDI